MEEESKEYLVLNTHQGLHRLNRLAFGIASAPAIWQRAMDQLLQGILDTQCILVDILITGIDDEHHLANVKAVSQRLEDAGLRANRQKCSFLQPKIDYCGDEVSEDGLHKMPAKVDAIQPSTCSRERQPATHLPGTGQPLRLLLAKSLDYAPSPELLLQKGTARRWTAACNQAFDKVKGSDRLGLGAQPFQPSLASAPRQRCLAVQHRRSDVARAPERHRAPDRLHIEKAVDCGAKLRANRQGSPRHCLGCA